MSRTSAPERFWAKVDRGGDCWLWTARVNQAGYGHFYLDGRMRLAHRVAYELTRGPIPDGLPLDHLCRRPACVRPDHLDPVPHRENMRRGIKGDLTTHCPKGHPYDDANTYRHGGHRFCRACNRAAVRRYKARRLL